MTAPGSPAPVRAARLGRALRFLGERYLTVDTRTLGLFRIGFGILCIANLFDRVSGRDGIAFYTNSGAVTNHFTLFAPPAGHIWSLLFGFSTPGEVWVAMAGIFAVYALYTFGWKTRAMKILLPVCLISLDNRILFLQIGGNVVMNIIAVWTAFLPLGERFSVDALLRSFGLRRERTAAHLRDRSWQERLPSRRRCLAYFFIVLNFAVIYFFNTLHKSGTTWRDGSAVHWVMWQNRIATSFAGWLRMHERAWLSPALTWGTLAIEGTLPALLLSPVWQRWTRPAAMVGIVALHGGISSICTLGPFSYAMMAFSLLLLTPANWACLRRIFVRPDRARTVIYDDDSPACHQTARLLVRLDGFRLLTFRGRSEGAPLPAPLPAELAGEPFVVVDPGGGAATGAAARRAIARALPLAFLWGWLARLMLRLVSRRKDSLGRALGLDRAPGEEAPPEPARAARTAARLLAAARDVLVVFIAVCVASQVFMENWGLPDAIRLRHRPDFMTAVIEYLRIPQGWSMFAPDAPRDDAVLVVDAVLTDGSHVDPLTGRSPDFDAPFHGPWLLSQQFCEWHARVRNARHLWPAFRDYLARIPQLERWPAGREIARFDVWEVTNRAPPPGSTTPTDVRKHLLFPSERP